MGVLWPSNPTSAPGGVARFGRVVHWTFTAIALAFAMGAVAFAPSVLSDDPGGFWVCLGFAAVTFMAGRGLRYILRQNEPPRHRATTAPEIRGRSMLARLVLQGAEPLPAADFPELPRTGETLQLAGGPVLRVARVHWPVSGEGACPVPELHLITAALA